MVIKEVRIMIPKNMKELNQAYEDSKKIATKAATASAVGGLSPVPGTDIAVDIPVLLSALNKINRRFGLTPEQIDTYDEKIKLAIYEALKKVGASLAGKYITKELIIAILKRLGIRVTARQLAKFLPIIGQIVSAGISFTAMKMVLNGHINECYKVCEEIINSRDRA